MSFDLSHALAELPRAAIFEQSVFDNIAGDLVTKSFKQLTLEIELLFEETNYLNNLSAKYISKHPGKLKILRNCCVPVLSQMKLNQKIGNRNLANLPSLTSQEGIFVYDELQKRLSKRLLSMDIRVKDPFISRD